MTQKFLRQHVSSCFLCRFSPKGTQKRDKTPSVRSPKAPGLGWYSQHKRPQARTRSDKGCSGWGEAASPEIRTCGSGGAFGVLSVGPQGFHLGSFVGSFFGVAICGRPCSCRDLGLNPATPNPLGVPHADQAMASTKAPLLPVL